MPARRGSGSAGGPTIGFDDLVREMVEEDLQKIEVRQKLAAMSELRAILSRASASGSRATRAWSVRRWCGGSSARTVTLMTAARSEVDLRRQSGVEAFVADARPQAVFLAAARVGGILANDSCPASFLYDNLMIAANVIEAARRYGVEKLLNLGSTCVYPKFAPQPIPRRRPAVRAARTHQSMVCRRQDRRDQAVRRLSPAIWLRFHLGHADQSVWPERQFRSRILACDSGADRQDGAGQGAEHGKEVVVWGTGTPRREFLHVDDCADALVHLMRHFSGEGPVNVGTGNGCHHPRTRRTDRAKSSGFRGSIVFDPSRPDGTPRKLSDVAG